MKTTAVDRISRVYVRRMYRCIYRVDFPAVKWEWEQER